MAENTDLYEQMQDYFETLKGTRPNPDDPSFKDAAGNPLSDVYGAALAAWGQEYRATATLLSNLEQEDAGIFTMPDGSIVPLSDVDPATRKAINQNNIQIYNQLLEKHGLSEYSLRRQSAMDENSRMMDEYTGKVDELRNKQSYDDSQLSRSLAQLDRWMSGQDVAGKDADRIADARREAQKYGTSNGKTSFSGRDLGAGVSMLAQQGGIGADAPLLQYPGTQTWDPVGDRQSSMESMGLGLAPPEIAPATVGLGDIPKPPTMGAIPTYGGGAPPAAPALLPPWMPVNPSIVTDAMKRGIHSQPSSQPAPPLALPPTIDIARQITAR